MGKKDDNTAVADLISKIKKDGTGDMNSGKHENKQKQLEERNKQLENENSKLKTLLFKGKLIGSYGSSTNEKSRKFENEVGCG